MNSGLPVRATLEEDGQLLHLLLDGGRGNIIDNAMIAALEATLMKLARSTTLKAVIIEGAGSDFCFGASVAEHRPGQAAAMLAGFHGFIRRLCGLGLPSIAAVRGQCLGGGLELAAFCTWIIASPEARFGQPEIKLAVFPPLASVVLPWRIGGGAAMDLCVSGRSIDAAEAARIGLVHTIADDPGAAARDFFARRLAPLSATSMRFAERAVRLSLSRLLERDLGALELMYLDELMTTADALEGIEAFLARRPPRFGGLRGQA